MSLSTYEGAWTGLNWYRVARDGINEGTAKTDIIHMYIHSKDFGRPKYQIFLLCTGAWPVGFFLPILVTTTTYIPNKTNLPKGYQEKEKKNLSCDPDKWILRTE